MFHYCLDVCLLSILMSYILSSLVTQLNKLELPPPLLYFIHFSSKVIIHLSSLLLNLSSSHVKTANTSTRFRRSPVSVIVDDGCNFIVSSTYKVKYINFKVTYLMTNIPQMNSAKKKHSSNEVKN